MLKIHFDWSSCQSLDILQISAFSVIAEGQCDTALPRASGATYPMHITLRFVRQVEVEDMGHVLHIDAAAGDVGRDEDGDRAVLETGECTRASTLALVTVDGDRVDISLSQLLDQPIRSVLGSREHYAAINSMLLD